MRIVKKCEVSNYPTWCGCLTPTEIIVLIDELNCRIDKFHEVDVQRARDKKKEGKSNPSWFYFYPSKAFLKYTK